MTLPASGAISFSQVNTELCRSSTATLSLNDSGVRGLFGQASGSVDMNTGHGKSNTSVPGAPTSVSASATSYSSASVSFSAPASNGGLTIDYYQAISSPGCITATGTSPISVTGLSAATAYTFRVSAHNSKGYGCYSSSSASITTCIAPGSQSYTSPGYYAWYAPTGVFYVSAVVVGGGVCSYGAALAYKNNIYVSPGTGYAVLVAYAQYLSSAGNSWFQSSCNLHASYYSLRVGDGGGNGGLVGGSFGGGGAGGYSGSGGQGGQSVNAPGFQGYGGGGAGGSAAPGFYCGCCVVFSGGAGGGGGVGIFGQGSNGTNPGCPGHGGGGGSGGSSGTNGSGYYGGNGGNYGGGQGRGIDGSNAARGTAGSGAVRLVWPGNTRQFPSTCVGSP